MHFTHQLNMLLPLLLFGIIPYFFNTCYVAAKFVFEESEARLE